MTELEEIVKKVNELDGDYSVETSDYGELIIYTGIVMEFPKNHVTYRKAESDEMKPK